MHPKEGRYRDNLAEELGNKARRQAVSAGPFPGASRSCHTLISCDRHKDGQRFAYKASSFIPKYSHWEAQEHISSSCLCRARLDSRDPEEGKPRVQINSLQRLLMQLSMQKHTQVSCPAAKGLRCQCLSEHLAHKAWVLPRQVQKSLLLLAMSERGKARPCRSVFAEGCSSSSSLEIQILVSLCMGRSPSVLQLLNAIRAASKTCWSLRCEEDQAGSRYTTWPEISDLQWFCS